MKSLNGDQNLDIATCLLQYAREKPRKSTEFDPSSKDDLEMLVNRLILLNDEYVNFKSEKKNTQNKIVGTRKTAKKPKTTKNIKKTQQLSETHSEDSEPEEFSSQDKDPVSQTHVAESLIESQSLKTDQGAVANEVIEEEEEQSVGQELEIDSLENRYLIIKQLQVHSMFDSMQNFDEKENEGFHYLEKPSFEEIEQGEQDIFEIISFE